MAIAAWLVDVGYIVKTAAKGLFKIDYVAAESVLRDRFGSVNSFLFNGYDASQSISEGLQRFYDAMRGAGMTVRLHPMTGSATTFDLRQRRVDVDLAAHVMWQASLPEVESIVITTGDQDFVPVVELAKQKFAVNAMLFTFDRDVSRELQAEVDDHLRFEDYRTQLELKR